MRWCKIEGLDTPVSPGSTIGGCLLVNAIKAEVAARLTGAGQPPKVLERRGGGRCRNARGELFEAAYDEHARGWRSFTANSDLTIDGTNAQSG